MLSGSAASTIASAIAGGNDDAEGAAAVVRDAIADAFVEQHLIYCECH